MVQAPSEVNAPLKKTGLAFCYPELVTEPATVHAETLYAEAAFDLALARKLRREGTTVVTNGFRLEPPERVLHFEREEAAESLRGKLDDELVRVHAILQQATGASVLVMNESFTSTTLHDASFLGTEILDRVSALGALCVYVTFVDELASLNEHMVSIVAAITPGDPASRTFRIERRPADGPAYAAAIAEKYGLTYESLKRPLAP